LNNEERQSKLETKRKKRDATRRVGRIAQGKLDFKVHKPLKRSNSYFPKLDAFADWDDREKMDVLKDRKRSLLDEGVEREDFRNTFTDISMTQHMKHTMGTGFEQTPGNMTFTENTPPGSP
jgi:hypothetical protein